MTATTAEKVCGTRAGYDRHRRRGEPIDGACRTAYNAYNYDRRAEHRAARRAMRAAHEAREARRAIEAAERRGREIRVLRLDSGSIPLGAYAGTDQAHEFVPDLNTGTSCMACFGWCTDYRHWAAS